MEENKIGFFEGRFYMLSNFSAHEVEHEGVVYATSEHAYQVAKFKDPETRERIKNAPSAFLAREYGQSKEGRTPDFDKVAVMKEIMREKLLQHEDVKRALEKTRETVIEKNHPDCSFWGTGEDGKGMNIMGKIWMELRREMRGL